MKKVIEKIEKIKGVEKVTETGCNELTVHVEKKRIAIECTNQEQFSFTRSQKDHNGAVKMVWEKAYVSIDKAHTYTSSKGFYLDHTIIPFSQYLSDYNLKDEWEKYLIGEAEKRGYLKLKHKFHESIRPACSSFEYDHDWIDGECCVCDTATRNVIYKGRGKWATIIEPELELISGEIYKRRDWIIRHKVSYCNTRTKQFSHRSFVYSSGINCSKPATNKQKAKLIKAELKNGYLWNGKDLIKYK